MNARSQSFHWFAWLSASFLLGAGLAACNAPGDDCKPGTEFCSCIVGQCDAGLTCTEDVCFDFGVGDEVGDGDGDAGESESDATDTDATDTDAESSTDTETTTTETDGGPTCGWEEDFESYGCLGAGQDPDGPPVLCPERIMENDPCNSGIPGIEDGDRPCCTADGNLFYCTDGGNATWELLDCHES